MYDRLVLLHQILDVIVLSHEGKGKLSLTWKLFPVESSVLVPDALKQCGYVSPFSEQWGLGEKSWFYPGISCSLSSPYHWWFKFAFRHQHTFRQVLQKYKTYSVWRYLIMGSLIPLNSDQHITYHMTAKYFIHLYVLNIPPHCGCNLLVI